MQNPENQPSLRYPWYVVFVLMIAYVSSFIDRQILSLLVGPMKRDLHLSDFQMSLLMGFSFAVFYTLLGIPAGSMADKGNRRNIINWGIGVWSLMTALGGVASNFGQLFLSRIGVGVGEATLSPAAYSIITDYFPKNKLATAIGVYSMGIYIGTGLAIVIGGILLKLSTIGTTWTIPLVGDIYPWQSIFFMVGLPGILIMLLMLTIKEPVRTDHPKHNVSISEAIGYLRKQPAFVYISFATGFYAMVSYSFSSWTPTFFARTFSSTVSQVSVYYGLSVAVFCTLGAALSGRFADLLLKRGYTDAKPRTSMMAAMGLMFSTLVLPLMPSENAALLLTIPTNFFVGATFAPAAASTQELLPANMRSVGSAVFLFVLNLMGLGLGPTITAIMTDYLFKDEAMLRYSLLIIGFCGGGLSMLLFSRSLKSYKPFKAV